MTVQPITYTTLAVAQGTRPTAKATINPAIMSLSPTTGPTTGSLVFASFSLPNLAVNTTSNNADFDKYTYISIESAYLNLTLNNAWTGTQVLRVSSIDGTWNPSNLTYFVGFAIPTTTIATQTITDAAAGTEISLDVTSMITSLKMYGGSKNWYGIEIILESGTGTRQLVGNSQGNSPTLEISYSRRPDTPDRLLGSTSTIISTSLSQPDLIAGNSSLVKDNDFTEIRAMISQVNTLPTAVTDPTDGTYYTAATAYDTGALPVNNMSVVWSKLPSADLDGTLLPELDDGDWVSWIATIKDANGLWSRWSDSHYIYREDKPTVTMVSPPPVEDSFLREYSPTISWEVSGGNQTAYRVILFDEQESKLVYDSGIISSEYTTHQIPPNYIFSDKYYVVLVRVYNKESTRVTGYLDGVAISPWAEATQAFSYQPSETVAPVTELEVTTPDPYPWVDLTWKRSEQPDTFAILRDGKIISNSDLSLSTDGYLTPSQVNYEAPDTYSYRDYGPVGSYNHLYSVVANVSNNDSANNPTGVSGVTTGIAWLMDKVNDVFIPIAGAEPVKMDLTEIGTTHEPLGTSYSVRITSTKKKYSGSVEGVLCGECLQDGTTAIDLQNYLLDMREASPDMAFRLLVANVNIPVVIYNVSTFPLYGPRYNKSFGVKFDFHQVSESFNPKIVSRRTGGVVQVTNLVKNPSTGSGTGWSVLNATTHTGSFDTTIYYYGGKSFKSVRTASGSTPKIMDGTLFGNYTTGTNTPTTTSIPVKPGREYVASIYLRAGQAGYKGRLNITEVSGAGVIGTTSGSYIALTAGQWTRVSVNVTSSSNNAAQFFVFNPEVILTAGTGNATSGHFAHADAAMLTQGNILYDYFDGGTTPTVALDYRWTGATNASTSEALSYGSD